MDVGYWPRFRVGRGVKKGVEGGRGRASVGAEGEKRMKGPDEDVEIEKRARIEAEKDTGILNPLGG